MKYLIAFLLSVLCLGFNIPSDIKPLTDSALKSEALSVLQTQCNSCHRTENPYRVFTAENMDGFAKKIHRQVFVWKRMPKGNNTLSEADRRALKNWIENLNL